MATIDKKLPIPLRAFNEFVEAEFTYAKHKGKPITREAAKQRVENHLKASGRVVEGATAAHRERIVESWESLGLCPEAAKIAAQVDESYAADAGMSAEDWANLKFS